MNDHEINLRLAEIAGIEHVSGAVGVDGDTRYGDLCLTPDVIGMGPPGAIVLRCEVKPHGYWSPLTDWSQLGPLIEAHVWDIERHPASDSWSVWVEGFERSVLPGATDSDLKRAICLAIIEAHKEQTDAQ